MGVEENWAGKGQTDPAILNGHGLSWEGVNFDADAHTGAIFFFFFGVQVFSSIEVKGEPPAESFTTDEKKREEWRSKSDGNSICSTRPDGRDRKRGAEQVR